MNPKHFTKEQILFAMSKTKSVRACARHLNCCYDTARTWMKLYVNDEGVSLFEQHKNQKGFGISKYLSNGPQTKVKLDDLLEGRIPMEHFTSDKVKKVLIREGYLKEVCSSCGFCERRVVDYKMPLILSFKDRNKKNFRIENVEMLCYNCYFLQVANIFTGRDMRQMEEHIELFKTTEAIEFQLDPWQLEQLKKLGMDSNNEEDMSGEEFVSRI